MYFPFSRTRSISGGSVLDLPTSRRPIDELPRSSAAERAGLRARARAIHAAESASLRERTRASRACFERAVQSLPLGVASTFQASDPYPVYVSHGRGARVWDVDGNEYVDMHAGFGAMLCGHAHPLVVEAIARAASRGTHFGAPTRELVRLAEVLCERFELERVRFCNSGTEATMHAIRIARAHTGRDHVVKIEGAYHGHHDAVMFSILPDSGAPDPDDLAPSIPTSAGIPRALAAFTHVVPFNDLGALERLLAAQGDRIACLILEPVMMNVGIAEPRPGYLQALKDLMHAHGALIVFDEVKTGTSLAPGGAGELYGVRPDLTCLAKATFGGTPGAAIGGRADVLRAVERGTAQHGTFNGNPLVVAAALAVLTEVMTPSAYARLRRLGARLASGCQRAIDHHGLPAHAVDLGAKGCVTYRREPLAGYRDFLRTDADLYAASHPWMLNRGIFMTPGREEQWTLSVQHEEHDVDRYVDAFGALCAELAR